MTIQNINDIISQAYSGKIAEIINAESHLYELAFRNWQEYRLERIVPRIKEVLRQRIAARKRR